MLDISGFGLPSDVVIKCVFSMLFHVYKMLKIGESFRTRLGREAFRRPPLTGHGPLHEKSTLYFRGNATIVTVDVVIFIVDIIVIIIAVIIILSYLPSLS